MSSYMIVVDVYLPEIECETREDAYEWAMSLARDWNMPGSSGIIIRECDTDDEFDTYKDTLSENYEEAVMNMLNVQQLWADEEG